MNAQDSARLELAYRAYHQAQPSEFRVQASALRILARMRTEKMRRRRHVRPLAFVGVLLVGALAYAASELSRSTPATPAEAGGQHSEAPSQRPGYGAQATLVLPPPAAAETTPPQAAEPERPAPRVDEPPPPAAAQAANRNQDQPSAKAPPRTSRAQWSDVARALDQGDERRAERALSNMLEKANPSERAKATLGLAQLALGRGDCNTASKHARALLENPSGARLHPRARGILATCKAPAPPNVGSLKD